MKKALLRRLPVLCALLVLASFLDADRGAGRAVRGPASTWLSGSAVTAESQKDGVVPPGGAQGEIILGKRTFRLERATVEEVVPGGRRCVYDVATVPPLRVEILSKRQGGETATGLFREVVLSTPGFSGAGPARFGADLTVRIPFPPSFRMTAKAWLPAKNGTGRRLGSERFAAYRFAGSLRFDGVPLAIPMVILEGASGPGTTAIADPFYSTLFSEDAMEWTYPAAVGLEDGRERRTMAFIPQTGEPAEALAAFYANGLPDVPPGPAWLHDIAMIDYDYMSDGGRGWFADIDALAAALPKADRGKVLLCLHGWYDYVGRYCFDRKTKTIDRSWTAFSNYPNVKATFPNSVPVAMTPKKLRDRLAYARSRGFRTALYFADGMSAGEELADIYAPDRVLYRGGWVGPDTKGKTFCQNPLFPEVRGFFLDYIKVLLDEFGGGLDALVWDETFHIPDGSLGTEARRGYADRAMMRLVKDLTAAVHAFNRKSGGEVAFMASDCIGVNKWVTKPPYALVADGTYQDTHCAPEAWSYGVFPNLRNVLWSCNWSPVTHWDYTVFGVRNYQTPVAISNGYGDDCGFAEMTGAMKRKVLDLFAWRKGFTTKLGWFEKLPEYPALPNAKAAADASRAAVSWLSWDTEGGDKVDTSLLRGGTAVELQAATGRAGKGTGSEEPRFVDRRLDEESGAAIYRLEAGGATVEWKIACGGEAGKSGEPDFGLSGQGDMEFSVSARKGRLAAARMVFPFDPTVTPVTILPASWGDDGVFRLPAVVNAPDFGPMLMREAGGREVRGRLEGDRKKKIDDLILELPEIAPGKPVVLRLTPLVLAAPAGLRDAELWRAARRGWLNALQPCARWGEQGKPFSAPPGILGNNVISDPASVSLWFYADQAFFTPEVAPGVSLMPVVRKTLDFWLEQRMRRDAAGRETGEITGYWDYGNFLDANASPLIAAWDYVEATGDLDWLAARIGRLELAADFLARRDIDGDGFVEATQSGNRGTLLEPNRSDAWWDALNCGNKDGYTNALIYRGWRSLADLEGRLGRAERRGTYARLADRLKAVYAKTLFNPRTGWLAWWKSRDGELHDYASPTLNGLAIEYGLVAPELAGKILDRLWKKIGEAGFTRFDLGVPPMLVPVRRSDYLLPSGAGIPSREDGTDTFGQYMNGGITAGHVLHFLAAHYVLGEGERADAVLRAMLERQRLGGFENGVRDAGGQGIDWTTWDGKPSGYEGYLADSFRFLQAVLLREAPFRARLYRAISGGEPK